MQVAVTLLAAPDTLSATALLLKICRRHPATRTCTRLQECLFDGGSEPRVGQGAGLRDRMV
jgi:hypothetical protein